MSSTVPLCCACAAGCLPHVLSLVLYRPSVCALRVHARPGGAVLCLLLQGAAGPHGLDQRCGAVAQRQPGSDHQRGRHLKSVGDKDQQVPARESNTHTQG
jgi:hypothetical protein